MSESYQYPTTEPLITRVYVDWLSAQDHSKAHAAPTPFRFSSAKACERSLGYDVTGVPDSDPMDGPSLAITGMGTLLHEEIQEAVAAFFPDAEFETKGQIGDLISGHIDIDIPSMDEADEIKTVGAFKFDQATGIQRKAYKRGSPAGPSLDHICQAGFNARARGRSNVRIIYISREAVSVPLARKVGLGSLDRFTAEWLLPESVWGPIVDAELARLAGIKVTIDEGFIPNRRAYDDKKDEWFEPDPESSRPYWACDYCRHRTTCVTDGPGDIPIPTRREP